MRSHGPFGGSWPALCYLPHHLAHLEVGTDSGRATPLLLCYSPVLILYIMGLLWKTKMRVCPYGSS